MGLESASRKLIFQTNSVDALTLDASQNATFAGDALIGGSVSTGETGTLSLNGTSGSSRYANIKKNYDGTFGMYINASLNASEVVFEIWGSTDTKYLGFDTSANATFAGNIVSGSTGGSSAGNITVSYNGATENGLYLRNTNTGASANVLMAFDRNGSTTGSITHTNSSTSYVTSSDYRLKENVVTDWDATTRLKQLKPSRFNFIVDADTTVDGFLAHEAQAVVPECVTGLKDAMKDEEYEVSAAVEATYDDDGNELTAAVEAVMATRSVPDYQGIDQSKLVPLLVKTIQELEARITALET
jgi:hypothetical protein